MNSYYIYMYMYHGTDLYARILHVVRFGGYRIYRGLLYLVELDNNILILVLNTIENCWNLVAPVEVTALSDMSCYACTGTYLHLGTCTTTGSRLLHLLT